MGQDAVHLQVIATSGEGSERKNAAKVLRLLERGKHWVLVTLVLGNVITNETLPIVLDRSLGGGWPAVVSSTILIGTSFLEHISHGDCEGLQARTDDYNSYFWRNHPTICMCTLWSGYR